MIVVFKTGAPLGIAGLDLTRSAGYPPSRQLKGADI
jgi:hypothetical protein